MPELFIFIFLTPKLLSPHISIVIVAFALLTCTQGRDCNFVGYMNCKYLFQFVAAPFPL